MIEDPESPQSHTATRPNDESRVEGDETDGAALDSVKSFCSNCEQDVEPGGKGHCPHCGRFLRDNVAALTHGGRRLSLPAERKNRRDELRKQVFDDLGGDLPPITSEVAEDFVSACILRDQLVGHLESIGPLTQRGTRRAAMDLYLATSARIERLSAMLGSYRTKLADDLEHASNGQPVVRVERVIIDSLDLGELSKSPEPTAQAAVSQSPQPADIEQSHEVAANPSFCSYCNATECVPDANLRNALHLNDPAEIQRRDKLATAVMMRQVGRTAHL